MDSVSKYNESIISSRKRELQEKLLKLRQEMDKLSVTPETIQGEIEKLENFKRNNQT